MIFLCCNIFIYASANFYGLIFLKYCQYSGFLLISSKSKCFCELCCLSFLSVCLPFCQGHENIQTHKSVKGQVRSSHGASSRSVSTHAHLTSEGVWSSIQEFARLKYQVL